MSSTRYFRRTFRWSSHRSRKKEAGSLDLADVVRHKVAVAVKGDKVVDFQWFGDRRLFLAMWSGMVLTYPTDTHSSYNLIYVWRQKAAFPPALLQVTTLHTNVLLCVKYPSPSRRQWLCQNIEADTLKYIWITQNKFLLKIVQFDVICDNNSCMWSFLHPPIWPQRGRPGFIYWF